MVGLAVAVINNGETTVTVVVAVLEQAPVDAVTVYVSVIVGVAITTEPLVVFKLVDAFHV